MADISRLYDHFGMEKMNELLSRAEEMARKDATIGCHDIQNGLQIGYEHAVSIFDWLADTHLITPEISSHWVRAGRRYVFNNALPTFREMQERVGLGEQRAYAVMQELARRKFLRITSDFELERVGRAATFRDLVRQMIVVSKKYHRRCEPSLLERTLFVDAVTAFRLAQYGEEFHDLYWKGKRWYRV
jgi:hypothetical protein